MLIGYARVSRPEQNLDMQLDALKKAGCEKIFAEKFTGRTIDRPQLNELKKIIRKGDVIIIWNLDRIARSIRDALNLLNELNIHGVDLKILQQPLMDTTTPIGKMMFSVVAMFAEFERNLILDRSKIGMEAARARGRFGGQKRKLDDAQVLALKQLYEGKQHTLKELEKMFKISDETIYNYVKNKRSYAKAI